MRIALCQLAPVPAEPERNLARLADAVRAARAELAVFPELYLSGYRVGDRIHRMALAPDGSDPMTGSLRAVARETGTAIVVGAPVASSERKGEVANSAVAVLPSGTVAYQGKRYLPTFGPFEEGVLYSPTHSSRPV